MTTGLLGATDVDLAGRLTGGEGAALEELFRRHAGGVRASVRHLLDEATGVEDAVQETFLELWRRPDRFRPERGTLETYLRMVARSRAIDRRRNEWARRRRESTAGREAGTDSVEEHVMGAIRGAHVRAALALLPTPQRAAIELAFFECRTYKEVADVLGQPEGTVKSRIRAGLHRLRAVLERFEASASMSSPIAMTPDSAGGGARELTATPAGRRPARRGGRRTAG